MEAMPVMPLHRGRSRRCSSAASLQLSCNGQVYHAAHLLAEEVGDYADYAVAPQAEEGESVAVVAAPDAESVRRAVDSLRH